VRTIGLPIKFSATPGGVARGAPLLGEHSRAILREHGWDERGIEALIAAGAVRG
jgi:crotonobetainyl-CoA:carnitine CoA-transferase CaiB-like acyl-CoA transferase